MTDWTSGYVAEIDYTHGYYVELNPARIKLAFTANGLAFPEIGTACELGFGQGLSTNIHAAASTVSWWGTDFNPSQAGFAQELGAITGAKVYDEAFAEFCNRSDLPEFDFIALHGIWSWISDENRRVIADFARRKLKVGGVLYISYNTLPGWSTAAPLRHLMTQHKEKMGASGLGIVNQVEGALDFTDRLLTANPLWARANPQIAERFKTIKPQNRHYLAHEYFNKDWHPMYFADMAGYLEPAKLSFAASAHYNDYLDAINLTADHQALLKGIPDNNFRQTVRDFMVNSQFRKDFWVKGPRRLNVIERSETLREIGFVLTTPSSEIPLKAKGILGDANLEPSIYEPIIELISDHSLKTFGFIEKALSSRNINLNRIEQAILLLIGQGYISPAADSQHIAQAKTKTQQINKLLLKKALASGDIVYLASPVIAGGVTVSRFQQMFILAKSTGHKTPDDWASFTWDVLSSQGQKILKDGKAIDSPEDNLAELKKQASTFQEKQLPILKALQVI